MRPQVLGARRTVEGSVLQQLAHPQLEALARVAADVQQAQRASKSSEPSPPSSGKSSFKTSPIASPSPSTSDLAAAADAESLYGPTGAPAGITTFGVPTAPSVPLTGAPLAARLLPLASPRETSFTEDDDESVRRTSVVSEIGPLRGETELGDDILPVPSADRRASVAASAHREQPVCACQRAFRAG